MTTWKAVYTPVRVWRTWTIFVIVSLNWVLLFSQAEKRTYEREVSQMPVSDNMQILHAWINWARQREDSSTVTSAVFYFTKEDKKKKNSSASNHKSKQQQTEQ